MHLKQLLKKITARKNEVQHTLPLLIDSKLKVEQIFKRRADLYEGKLLRKSLYESFVFEDYYLQLENLSRLTKNTAEQSLINEAKWNVCDILSNLYQIIGKDCEIINNLELVKTNHLKRLNYNLIEGARNNDNELVEIALKAGANPNFTYDGDNAFMCAVKNKNKKMSSLLISSGVDVNQPKIELTDAYKVGTTVIKLMLEAGYSCDPRQIAQVIRGHSSDLIELLITYRADQINHAKTFLQQRYGYDDLLFNVAIGNQEKVHLLLTTHDLDKQDLMGNSSLMIAAKLGRTEIVRTLIESDAAIDAQNNSGETALMLAAQNGHSDVVTLLLQHNADVNKKTIVHPAGMTALYRATENEHTKIVKMLLNVDNIDTQCQTASFTSANELGLSSANPDIVNAYKMKNTKPAIDKLEAKLNHIISEFRENTHWLDLGNNQKKALKIQKALARAKTCEETQYSIEEFLNRKVDGKKSINEALSFRRMGLFTPTSKKNMDEYVSAQKKKRLA